MSKKTDYKKLWRKQKEVNITLHEENNDLRDENIKQAGIISGIDKISKSVVDQAKDEVKDKMEVKVEK